MAFDPAILTGILGMGTSIAGAIPGLKKVKRSRAASKAASTQASKQAKAAVGASATGHGASRGLALREGLRASVEIGAKGALEAGQAAAGERDAFREDQEKRRENIMNFTQGLAGGISQMTQGILGGKQDKAADETIQEQPEMADSATGLGSPAAGTPPEREALGSTTEGLQQQEAPDLAALEQEQEQALVEKNAAMAESDPAPTSGPAAAFATSTRLEELRAKSPTVAAPHIEQYLDDRLRAKKLMLQDAERLGMDLSTIIPMVNRQLDLKPGQSAQNPLGVSLDYSDGDE